MSTKNCPQGVRTNALVDPSCSCCFAKSEPPTKPITAFFRTSFNNASISGVAGWNLPCSSQNQNIAAAKFRTHATRCGERAVDIEENQRVGMLPVGPIRVRCSSAHFVCGFVVWLWARGGRGPDEKPRQRGTAQRGESNLDTLQRF